LFKKKKERMKDGQEKAKVHALDVSDKLKK
jgi:hypothetical protein